eukprot:TRINITY_DN24784_c0_g1_i1.p2 TRINITY_DN24784_c0_g1~~TRINITY_DN24784_c0_g1_i1.p2  ORF type:complete len:254 (+),score=67.29 TRINITY_DN24784_c0_g1_i1:40-762(+)
MGCGSSQGEATEATNTRKVPNNGPKAATSDNVDKKDTVSKDNNNNNDNKDGAKDDKEGASEENNSVDEKDIIGIKDDNKSNSDDLENENPNNHIHVALRSSLLKSDNGDLWNTQQLTDNIDLEARELVSNPEKLQAIITTITDDEFLEQLSLEAARTGTTEVLKIMESNYNIAMPPSHLNTTPLHIATNNLHVETVSYLLSKGASCVREDKLGRTPVDILLQAEVEGAAQQRREICQLFL